MSIFALAYTFVFVKNYSNSLLLDISAVFSKLKWFFVGALPVGFDLPGLLTHDTFANFNRTLLVDVNFGGVILLCLMLLSMFGFIAIASQNINQSIPKYVLYLKYIILIMIFGLSISPLFLSSTTSTCYRRFHTMQAIVAYLAINGIYMLMTFVNQYIVRISYTIGVGILVIIMAVNTHATISYKVRLLSEELRFIQEALKSRQTSKLKLIHVIQSDKISVSHDFVGFMTSVTPWVPGVISAVRQDLDDSVLADNTGVWDLGQATNRVTASTLIEFEEGKVLVDPFTTLVININDIRFLLNASASVYRMRDGLETDRGIGASYHPRHSVPIVQDFSSCCNGGTPLSSGDYDGFCACDAFDDDFVTTRWAGSDVGPNIYHTAYLGYDFGPGRRLKISTIVIRQASTLQSVLVQASDDGISWVDIDRLALVADSNIRAYKVANAASHRLWRLLADDKLPFPAAWAIYELKFLE